MKNIRYVSTMTTCLIALSGMMYSNTGWTKSVEHQVKEWLDDAVDSLKKGVDKIGDSFDEIQDYFDNYDWKGIVERKATDGPATLKYLELNDNAIATVVKPGQKIDAEVKCELNRDECSTFGMYRIVVG